MPLKLYAATHSEPTVNLRLSVIAACAQLMNPKSHTVSANFCFYRRSNKLVVQFAIINVLTVPCGLFVCVLQVHVQTYIHVQVSRFTDSATRVLMALRNIQIDKADFITAFWTLYAYMYGTCTLMSVHLDIRVHNACYFWATVY